MADQTSVIIDRANSALVARDFLYAEKLLLNLLKQDPDVPDALNLLGTVYLRSDRWENALSVFKKLSEIDVDNVDVLNNLGVIYRRLGKYGESIEALTRAKKTGKDFETVLYNLGNTYKQMGDYSEAALCFSDVIDQKPDDVLAYNHLGSIHALSGRHDLALQAWRRGLQIDPNHPFIHYNMAHSYESLDRPSEAIAEYSAALKTKPGWPDALRDLAKLYSKQKDEASCVATLRRILAVDPSDAKALVDMGSIAARHDRLDEALAYYKKATNSDKDDHHAVFGLVQLLEKQGKGDEALSELLALSERKPDAVDVLVNLARLYVKLEQYPEAKATFMKIEAAESDNVAALRIKGRMFAQMGNNEEAELCFAKILAINPNEIDFRIDLAEQLVRSGKLPEAEEQLLAYLVERPRDGAVRITLGQVYEAMNRLEQALIAYKDVLSRERDNIDALTALSLLYQRTGRNTEAVRLADEIVNMQGSRAEEGDLSKLTASLDLYEQAVRRYGSNNPGAMGRNLDLLRSREITDDGLDEAAELPVDAVKDAFVPVDEESDPLTLLEDEELVDEGDFPFDELVIDADGEGEKEAEDESLDDLVSFEEPLELGASGFGPEKSFPAEGSGAEIQLDSVPEELPEEIPPRETSRPAAPRRAPQPAGDTAPAFPEPASDMPLAEPPYREIPGDETSRDEMPYAPPLSGEPEPVAETAADEGFLETGTDPAFDSQMPFDDELVLTDAESDASGESEVSEEMPALEFGSDVPEGDGADERKRRFPGLPFPLYVPVLPLPDLEDVLMRMSNDELLELFNYFKMVTRSLPDDALSEYLLSEERIKLEYVIDRLAGKSGLKDDERVFRIRQTISGANGQTLESSVGKPLDFHETMDFLHTIASKLPDEGFVVTLSNKLDKIEDEYDKHDA